MPLTNEQISSLEQQLTSKADSTSVDGLSVKNRSIDEIIKALNYARSLESANDTQKRPFRLQFFRSPGGIYGS